MKKMMTNSGNIKVRRICSLLLTGVAILFLVFLVHTTGHAFHRQYLGENINHISVTNLNSNITSQDNPGPWDNNNIAHEGIRHTREDHGLKVTHVNFLKVHKAGSTTMQNLLFRFGLRYGLNILLPKRRNFLIRKSSAVAIPPTEHFDIFAIHTIYNQELMDTLLPKDTVNIAIVREPTSRMISAAYYCRDNGHQNYLMKIPRRNFIHRLVQNPARYDRKVFSNTKNRMAKDFGFPASIKPTDTVKISERLEYLDKQFSLVMIMEQMDESLVLLRRLLNWSHLDIIYLKANSHKHEPVQLTPEDIYKYRKTSYLDFALYEYFEQRLDEKIAMESEDFRDEVLHFKNILIDVKQFCNAAKEGESLRVESSQWSEMFDLRYKECMQMKQLEIIFIKKIRKNQYRRHRIKH